MNITIGGRGSGRTTKLIKACAADKGSVIVSPTRRNAEYIANLAKQMGLDIPEPISFEQFQNRRYQGNRVSGFYFDNLDAILSMLSGGVPICDATFEAILTENVLWLDPTQN